jgi:hypothetical protein
VSDVFKLPRSRHVFFGLVSGVVAALAVSVSPASANQTLTAALSHPPLSKFCGQTQPAFAPLSRLTARTTSVARGAASDVAREPSSTDTAEEVPASAKGKGGPKFRATVDVYYHVVYDPAIPASNVSDTAISEQTTVANLGFGGFEGGVNTGFRFKQVGVDRTANVAWFNAAPGTQDEKDMKKALHRGDASDLNIYLTTASFYLGWAYFPSTYKTKPWLDGIVIDWESMPGTSTRYAGAYDLGKTVTHEAGHWFGLYHVFQGGCNNWGDYVADTPPQLIATRGCPEGQDSCKEPGLDSIHNYMDYSYDSCYDQFTAGQTARMQDQWLFFRADGGSTTPAQG